MRIADDFFRAFSPAQVAAFHNLALEMDAYGASAEDVIEWAEDYFYRLKVEAENFDKPEEERKPLKPVRKVRPQFPCPECGAPLKISLVNISKCTNIGGGYKTSFECSASKCAYTELSKKSVQELGY